MGLKRAGSNDIKKLIELIKSKLSTLSKVAFSGKYSDLVEKATAADVGALPLTGGTLEKNDINLLNLKNTSSGAVQLNLMNSEGTLGWLHFSNSGTLYLSLRNDENRVRDCLVLSNKVHQIGINGELKNILLQGDYIKPTVKATSFAIKDGNLKVKGTKSNVDTDITEIVKKAYTGSEGMTVGIATNGMGYIVAQNFFIDCSLITDDERKLIQSFDFIKIEKANDSSDYPTLMPTGADYEVGVGIIGKNGYIDKTVKMGIRSNNSTNYFYYTLPSEFKNDDNSSNNLRFATREWATFVGIDVKSR